MKPDTLTLDRIRTARIIAVIRAPSADDALRVTDALVSGGVTGIEITFSTRGGRRDPACTRHAWRSHRA